MSDKKIDDGGPAFPTDGFYYGECKAEPKFEGMSIRDYFAAEALQGLLGGDLKCCPKEFRGIEVTPENVSLVAFALADAMIRERGKYD